MGVWLLEGQSSQRDLLLALKRVMPAHLTLYASHRKYRPEITDCADVAWQEPRDDRVRAQWALQQAIDHQIQVVWACRRGQVYEPLRAQFEQAGIILITGATQLTDLQDMDNKFAFTTRCQAAGIPVAQGQLIQNAAELTALLEQTRGQVDWCVKPVQGIFGEGFWRLIDDLSTFRCFLQPDERCVNTAQFVAAYQAQTQPKALLAMPYLSGAEYSIDAVCEHGQMIAAIVRDKQADKTQQLSSTHPVLDLARQVLALFGCDGLVNLQTKGDAQGVQHVLEINARPSGGVSYTEHLGINLAALTLGRRLGWALPPSQVLPHAWVRPITTSVHIHPQKDLDICN